MTERQARHLKRKFLEAFRLCGIVSWAAREAGLSNRTLVYDWLERDDQFAAAYRDAEIESTETMEAEAHRRGVLGSDKLVYQGGRQVGTVREYSDVLLIFMLKARRPDKYRDKPPVDPDQNGAGLDVTIHEQRA